MVRPVVEDAFVAMMTHERAFSRSDRSRKASGGSIVTAGPRFRLDSNEPLTVSWRPSADASGTQSSGPDSSHMPVPVGSPASNEMTRAPWATARHTNAVHSLRGVRLIHRSTLDSPWVLVANVSGTDSGRTTTVRSRRDAMRWISSAPLTCCSGQVTALKPLALMASRSV